MSRPKTTSSKSPARSKLVIWSIVAAAFAFLVYMSDAIGKIDKATETLARRCEQLKIGFCSPESVQLTFSLDGRPPENLELLVIVTDGIDFYQRVTTNDFDKPLQAPGRRSLKATLSGASIGDMPSFSLELARPGTPSLWKIRLTPKGQQFEPKLYLGEVAADPRTADAAVLILGQQKVEKRDAKASSVFEAIYRLTGLVEAGSLDCDSRLFIRTYSDTSFMITLGCDGGEAVDVIADFIHTRSDLAKEKLGDFTDELLQALQLQGRQERDRALVGILRKPGAASAIRKMAGSLEFQTMVRQRAMARFLNDVTTMRASPLVSTRALAFIYTTNLWCGCAKAIIQEAFPPGGQITATSEQQRMDLLEAHAQTFRGGLLARLGGPRLSLFKTGKATIGNVSYDLDALGITLDPVIDRPL